MNTNVASSTCVAACLTFALLLVSPEPMRAQGLDFSLSEDSPKVPGSFRSSDIINAGGAEARIPALQLGGGAAAADVIGISYGQAEAANVNTSPYYYKRLAYSVDRNAVGVGAPIATEVAIDGAAGDTFALDFVGVGSRRFVLRSPFNLVKAQLRNLTVKAGAADPEDDLDGLSLFRDSTFPVYLSFAPGGSFDPAAIYIVESPGGPPEVFASAADLGLAAGDVIDAFALGSVPFGDPPPTVLNPNVVIWISLAIGSPTRAAGPDEILHVWPAPVGTVLSAAQMNLDPDDEINAIALLDPGIELEEPVIRDGTRNIAVAADVGSGLSAQTKVTLDSIPDFSARLSVSRTDDAGTTTSEFIDLGPNEGGGFVEAQGVAINDGLAVVPLVAQAGGGWTPNGETIDTNGSFLAFYDCEAPLSFSGAVHLSPSSGTITSGVQLHQSLEGGENAASICVSNTLTRSGEGEFAVGGVTLNPGTFVSTASSFFADVAINGEVRLENPRGITIHGSSESGTPVDVRTQPGCDSKLFDGDEPGIKIAHSVFSFESSAATLETFEVTPLDISELDKLIALFPSTYICSYQIDTTTNTVSRHHLIQVAGESNRPRVSAALVTADCTFFGITTSDRFTMLGKTYGTSGRSSAHIIGIDFSGETAAETFSFQSTPLPPTVETEIVSLSLTGAGDELVATGTTTTFIDLEEFRYIFFGSDGGSSATIHQSAGAFREGFGFSIDLESAEVGRAVAALVAGPAEDRFSRQAIFTGALPCGNGIELQGQATVAGSTILPGNHEISIVPATAEMPPRQVFSAWIRNYIGTTYQPPTPTIRISLEGNNAIRINYSGDNLWRSTTMGQRSWNRIPGATSPYLVPLNTPRMFYRASR